MHSTRLIPVEGHNNLKRDPNTNAILSTNDTDYEKYVNERARRQSLESKVESTSKELSELKSEINEIKNLLIELVNK